MYYEYGGIITHRIPCVFSTDMQTIEYNRDELWSYYSQREEIVPIMASAAAAVELSKAGIEKIHIESFEVHESGWMSIILVDELNYRYLVETDKYGYIQFIYENDENGVRRHIVGGANSTLFSVFLPPRLHSSVGNRRLWAEQPHIVVALFERQDSCF